MIIISKLFLLFFLLIKLVLLRNKICKEYIKIKIIFFIFTREI